MKPQGTKEPANDYRIEFACRFVGVYPSEANFALGYALDV